MRADLPGLKTMAEINTKYRPVKDNGDDDDDDDDNDEDDDDRPPRDRAPRGFAHIPVCSEHISRCSAVARMQVLTRLSRHLSGIFSCCEIIFPSYEFHCETEIVFFLY